MLRLASQPIIMLFLATLSVPVQSGEISIPDAIREQIGIVVSERRPVVSLDLRAGEQDQLIFREWVSGSIDIQRADRRDHERFKRTSYTVTIRDDLLRLPTERLQLTPDPISEMLIPELRIESEEVVNLEESVKVIYREGTGYFKFHKLKETATRNAMSTEEAIKIIRNFLLDNAFIRESEKDRVGDIHVEERHINEEGEEGESARDYLVQQDIILRRFYLGMPVINSKVAVGLLPDTREIIQIDHFNWTLASQESGAANEAASVTSVQHEIEAKIRATSGNFSEAQISEVIPAWFQTESALIPVIAFGIDIEYPSPIGPLRRRYTEVLNLAGEDEILWPEQRRPAEPSSPGLVP